MPTATINKDGAGRVTISQNPNPITLDYDVEVSMNVGSGFPSGSKISKLTLFNNVTTNDTDAKGAEIGSWDRDQVPATQPDVDLTITADGNNIKVKDSDTRSDTKVWYSLVVSQGVSTWSADPEMIVRAKVPN